MSGICGNDIKIKLAVMRFLKKGQIISVKKILMNKELIFVILSQIVGLVISIVFVKLASHYMSVSEYGVYSLALSIAAFIALFPFSSFDQAIGRYISVYHSENTYAKNYTNILFLYMILVVLLSLATLVVHPLIKNLIPRDILNIFYILIIFTILNILKTMLLQIENFNRNRKIVLCLRIFEGILRIVLLIAVIYYSYLTAYKILFISCAIFLVDITLLVILRRKDLVFQGLSLNLLKINFQNFYHFSTPLLIWAVFSWIQLYSTTWFLQYFTSMKEVGYFNLLNTIALIIPTQLVGIIGAFIVPIMYQKEEFHKGYTREKTKEITFYLSILLGLITIFLFFFHSFVVGILSSSKYLTYSWMLPYLFLASSISSIAALWTYEFFVYKKTKQLLLPQILPSVLSIIACYFLIPHYGIEGVMYVLILTSSSYIILVLITNFKTFSAKGHI